MSIKVIEVSDDCATVKTKKRYRVVCHRKDGTEYIESELVSLRTAFIHAQTINHCSRHGGGIARDDWEWAEIIDYKEVQFREQMQRCDRDFENYYKRRITEEQGKQKGSTKRLRAIAG